MFCQKCGNQLLASSKFCEKCGEAVETVANQSDQTPTQTLSQTQTSTPPPPPPPQYQPQYQEPQHQQPQYQEPQHQHPQYQQPKPQKTKKKKPILIISLLIVAILATGTYFGIKYIPQLFNKQQSDYSSFADPSKVMKTEKWGFVPVNQITVVLKEGISKSKAQKIASDLKGNITGEVSSINLYLIDFPSDNENSLNTAIDKAQNSEGVDIVAPNSMVYGSIKGTQGGPFDDPLYKEGKNSKNYSNIGMSDSYKILKAAGMELSTIKVGVADDALYNNSSNSSSETSGKTKFKGDSTNLPEKDDNGNVVDGGNNHGTMVTHVIAANGDNGGVTGVASILGDKLDVNVSNIYTGKTYTTKTIADPNDPTKVTFSDGTFYHNTIVKLQNLVDSGAKVINCSYGPDQPDAKFNKSAEIYTKFFEKMAKDHPDVVFVAAAGNEKGELDGKNYYPGGLALPNIITVGATNDDGTRAGFSNFSGATGEVTIAAPGVDIPMGTQDNGATVTASGTSFASPMVAGTVALMKSIKPNLTAAQIKDIIKKTSATSVQNGDKVQDIPVEIGGGILRVDNAVFEVINMARSDKGLPPLDRDFLIKMSTIEFSAKGGPKDFTLEANIPAVNDKGTDLILDVTGQHAITKGNSKEHVTAAGTTTWTINAVDKSVYVKVTRTDTGAYAYLTLNTEIPLLSELAGHWTGNFTVVDFDAPATVTVPDDIIAGTTKEEGCADKLEAIKNIPQPITLDIEVLTETTCKITMIMTDQEKDPNPQDFVYNYNQEEGQLSTTVAEQNLSVSMYASKDDKNYILSDGAWSVDVTQEGKRFMIKATLDALKPKP